MINLDAVQRLVTENVLLNVTQLSRKIGYSRNRMYKAIEMLKKERDIDYVQLRKEKKEESLENQLSTTERKVFELMRKNYTNEQIASELEKRRFAISTTISKIYAKLKITKTKKSKRLNFLEKYANNK